VLAWGGLISTVLRIKRLRIPGWMERRSRFATLLFLISGAVTGAAGLLGLSAVALSERVTPDLVSGRFAFLTGTALILAAVAGTFLIWTRLAAGDSPASPEAVPAEADGNADADR